MSSRIKNRTNIVTAVLINNLHEKPKQMFYVWLCLKELLE